MAIAFDTSNNGSATATSLTIAHTVSATANPIIICGVRHEEATASISSVKYATVDLVKIEEQHPVWPTDIYAQLWMLAGPATGANNMVITASASVFIGGATASYTGCTQSNTPDSHNSNKDSTGTVNNLTTSTTVVAANCWLIGYTQNDAGGPAGGAGTTIRASGNALACYDSNGTVGTGSQSLNATTNGTGNADIAGLLMSISPFGTVVASTNNWLLMGS